LNQEQLRAFRAWFDCYVRDFSSHDPEIRAAVALKDEHTRRVCDNIVRAGRSLNLGVEELHLAETIALFHDIGRFRQFTSYCTFNDRRSENHALLGLRELERAGVLSGLAEEEREVVTQAVRRHNLRDLPPDLADPALLFTRLIRDADKLDILKIFTEALDSLNRRPNPLLRSSLPDTPEYSPVFLENLLQGKLCSYDDMKNFNDRKLLMLSWVYDINFPHTLAEIDRQGYLERIAGTLPETGEIRQVYTRLRSFMTRRLAAAGKASF